MCLEGGERREEGEHRRRLQHGRDHPCVHAQLSSELNEVVKTIIKSSDSTKVPCLTLNAFTASSIVSLARFKTLLGGLRYLTTSG